MVDAILIYGATGTTGQRIAELAVADGVAVIVAGRRAAEVAALADRLGCEGRTTPLEQIATVLDGVAVVVSCVGPYTHFGAPVLDAAVRAGAHYVDLTGEPRFVQTMIDRYDQPAADAGATLVPSAGLGLCSGLTTQAALDSLPGEVNQIAIGYRPTNMLPSTGTLRSSFDILAGGAAVAERGEVRWRAPGSRLAKTPVGLGARFPLTDILLLNRTLPGVSIDSYMVAPVAPAAPILAATMLAVNWLARLDRSGRVLRAIENRATGSNAPRGGFSASVTASGAGGTRTATVDVDDLYETTSRAALTVARALLAGQGKPGVQAAASCVSGPAEIARAIGAHLSR